MIRIEDVLYCVVRKHQELHPDTSLRHHSMVNLLYLADRKSVVHQDSRLTNLQYNKYRRGPYSTKIEEATDKAEDKHMFHQFTSKGQDYVQLCNCPAHEVNVEITDNKRRIIEDTVEWYGGMDVGRLSENVMMLPEVRKSEKYSRIHLPMTR